MNHLEALLNRLPPLYTLEPGSILYQLMALFSNHLTAYDEDLNRVQRSHWVNTALDRQDLAQLGALFDIAPAPWEPADLYRQRLKATVAARLQGAVSRDVLEFVLVQILDAAQQSLGSRYVDLPATAGTGQFVFHTGETTNPLEPVFVEFPQQRRRSPDLVHQRGLLRSLDQVTLTNRGLHPVPLQGVVRGVNGQLTSVPVLVNLTNGQVLAYVGHLPCGQELHLGLGEAGTLTARVGDRNVLAQVYTGSGFVAGAAFTPVVPDPSPQPLQLERGENQLWYFPLALFDAPSLNAGVYGMPTVDLQHGRFAGPGPELTGTRFNTSLFEQPTGVCLDLWWDEDCPASFRFELPTGAVRQDIHQGELDPNTVTALFSLLQETLNLLRAAGVNGRVVPRPLRETQPQRDQVRVLNPTQLREEMRLESRLSGLSALFDISAEEGSRFA